MREKDRQFVRDLVDGKIAELKRALKDEFAHVEFRFTDITWPAQSEVENLSGRVAQLEILCALMATGGKPKLSKKRKPKKRIR
jgi:hypothetical protein